MKTIPEILNITPEHYEQRLIFGNYMLWCDLNANTDREVQNLLANTAIFNWWLFEWRELEREFKETAQPYIGKAEAKTLLQLYVETTVRIRDFFPQPLLQKAQKRRIEPEHN